jgi:hypothetical protein
MRFFASAACSAAAAALALANLHNQAAATAASPDADGTSLRLEKVVVIARHGARSPTMQFPFIDSYLDWRRCSKARSLLRAGDEQLLAYPLSAQQIRMNKDCDACSVGELTDDGMYQLQRIGDAHRQRYIHALGLLPPCVADGAELVRARASPFARTVQSCRAFLDGLYGNCGDGIDIVVGTEKQETLLPHSKSCPRIGELCGLQWTHMPALLRLQPWTHMPALLRLQPEQLRALDAVRSAMDPTNERQRHGFIGMYDSLHSRSFHGCDLPTLVCLIFKPDRTFIYRSC